MKYSLTTPVGIDVPIKNLQAFLYRGLISLWGLTESQVRAFARAYRLDGKIKVFDSSNYLDADGLMDDAYALQFFFLESERRDFVDLKSSLYGTHFTVPVEIYFFVNLLTVKSSLSTIRADEQVKQDVFNIVLQGSGGFLNFDKIELENYNEKMNMQPYHSFKVVTNLIYRYDKTI